ncbi:MAG: AraC family transcriptional regulator [Spirochaetaceae bacterium]|nr:AraC family transcriptional regulator [Spirochaetaceae bacterium]
MIKRDILTTDLLYVWSQESNEVYSDIHCHAEYELYYFICGDVERRIEGRRYVMTPESLLLIPPNSVHEVTIQSTRPHRRISVHFVPELLDDAERSLLLELFHAPLLYYPEVSVRRIGFLVQSVLDCKDMDEPLQKAAIKHRTISLLTHIYQLHLENMVCTAPKNERIQAVLQYLNRNLREPVSLDRLAREFYISKNHLNVVFHRETGTTIHQYVRIKRLVMARQEIRKGTTAEEAAYKAGFNDYSNFYRAYKAFFGIVPSDKVSEWPVVGERCGVLGKDRDKVCSVNEL